MARRHDDEGDAPMAGDIAGARPADDAIEQRRVFAAVKQRLFSSVEARAVRVGRFSVLERLGSGGMGVVYAAYDPELDRKVALKLVALDAGGDRDAARDALVAEARAAAKLDHPNVVSVFDAGVHDDYVYIAMEFVAGETVRDWLGREHEWTEIVGVFVQAGRGLAAAHAAGVVHRDVKPSNIMLGRDATGELRARILDFGIARAADGEPGGSAGTPGYMAPEQYRGEPTSAAADQFGFCASLWEALYGDRPFAPQASIDATLGAIARGPADPPAGRGRAPDGVRAAIARGLHADAGQRHGSMAALVEVLSRDRSAGKRRRVALVGAGVIALALAATAFAVTRDRDLGPQCSGDAPELQSAWNDERRATAALAFEQSELSYAAATWSYIERELDAYRDEWATAHLDACEANHVHGTQSDDLLDRRMSCLHQRSQELAAVVDVFAHADASIVVAGVRTLGALLPISSCSDTESLTALVPPPEGQDARAAWRGVQSDLAVARAATSAGKYAPAQAQLEAMQPTVESLGYAPATAELYAALASVRDQLGDHAEAIAMLQRALLAAENGRDDYDAALVAVKLAFIAGYRKHDIAVGTQWLDLADAKLARTNSQRSSVGGEAHNVRAMLAYQDGRFRDSIVHYEHALELRTQLFGAGSTQVAATLNNLGNSYNDMGDLDEAIAHYRRALEVRRAALGNFHPYVATTLTNLGTVLKVRAGPKAAIEVYEEALAIRVRAFGENHVDTAWTINNLANAYKDGGQLDKARTLHERALAIRTELFGERHVDVAVSLFNIGSVLHAQNDCAAALPYLERAAQMWAESVRTDHPHLGYPLSEQGTCLHQVGRTKAGIALLERALKLREGGDQAGYLVGTTRFWLARARWDAGGDRVALTAEIERARAELGTEAPDIADEIAAWLGEHGSAGP